MARAEALVSNADNNVTEQASVRAGRVSSRTLLACAWTFLILLLCWFPHDELILDQGVASFFELPHFDKFVHGAMFAVFGILWMRVGTAGRRASWVIAGGIALAAVTEIGQGLMNLGRQADILDAMADVVGVASSVWAFRRFGHST